MRSALNQSPRWLGRGERHAAVGSALWGKLRGVVPAVPDVLDPKIAPLNCRNSRACMVA